MNLHSKIKKQKSGGGGFFRLKKNALIALFSVLLIFGVVAGVYAFNYNSFHALNIQYIVSEEGAEREVEPYDKLYVKFTQPVSLSDFESSLTFSPDIDGTVSTFSNFIVGDFAYGFALQPSQPLEPEMEYELSLSELTSFFGTKYDGASVVFSTIKPPEVSSIAPTENDVASIDSAIEIQYDGDSRFFRTEYSLKPEVSFEVVEDDNKTVLIPDGNLEQGTDYTLIAKKYFISDDNLGKRSESVYSMYTHSFKTVDPVVVLSATPQNLDDDTLVSSEIAIEFSKPVLYSDAEEAFSIDPEVEGNFGWENTTLVFEPKDKLPSPQEFTVTVKAGVQAFEDTGFLNEDYQFTFTTKRHEKEIEPDEDLVPKIAEGKYIDVDLGSQYLTLFEDGKSRGSFQVSSGRYDLPTPRGEFSVINKVPLAYSNTYDLYMPFWMAFTYAGHGFHELPFWKFRGGVEYKERESNLGTPVSHGCVRLGVGPAEIVYNFADIGTPIIIHD